MRSQSAVSIAVARTLAGCAAVLAAGTATLARADDSFLKPDTLVISASRYDRTQGAVAALTAGTTQLANSDTATVTAVAGNLYPEVWNNAAVDGSFGVTSPISLWDVDARDGRLLGALRVPTEQVVTSFSSKSELGLHIARGCDGLHLTFMGYASPGVGALDVSNSDAVPGQDPTNPVTSAFGSTYAFHRTIVAVNERGELSFTPTVDYGGNNGRSALLGSNGLYYSVGNANNGNAAVFGAANGTDPDVTETTGLEVVTPIDARRADVAIPPGNSAEVDPLVQYSFTQGKSDKPGKDDNYRGMTEYQGALYFTKGSGSNGMDTVYTVGTLPTVADAAAQTISVVPGFPTDSAKATGGNFTPFALFFANPTTLYVSDEGSGNATDAAAHAGLEKWSLVGGTWQLDYVLTNGLLGVVATDLDGYDGPYPDVTTVGLRNLTGRVNRDGTVTLWATTSTASASGDQGADPNRVVAITDQLAATTMTPQVAAEAFATLAGPTYGVVYRGVAYVPRESDRDDGHRRDGWSCADR